MEGLWSNAVPSTPDPFILISKQKRREPKLYGIISKLTFVNDARVIGNIIK